MASVRLDETDRFIINSPISEDTPIADQLQNLQLLVFRIEQQQVKLFTNLIN